jgi:hypothetical protein
MRAPPRGGRRPPLAAQCYSCVMLQRYNAVTLPRCKATTSPKESASGALSWCHGPPRPRTDHTLVLNQIMTYPAALERAQEVAGLRKSIRIIVEP